MKNCLNFMFLWAIMACNGGFASEKLQPVAPVLPGAVTVHPREIKEALVNPYCGWGLWAGPRFFDSRQFPVDYNTKGFGDDAPLFSWVLVDWMWADLEPKEGQFDWKDLDAIIDYWKARDKQIVVRLWQTTDPGWAGAPGNKACPDWLWDAGVKYHEYKGEGGVKQRCPAYADPSWESIYLPKLKNFLTAYRDRYHKPGSPIVLDYVMSFGDWGEWHTMWSHYPWPNREKKREVLGKAIAAYMDVFAPNRPDKDPVRQLAICHVYDDDCGGETPLGEAMRRQALDIAAGRGFAFARNGFIDGLSGWPNELMNQYWQDHQLIAEGNWSYEQVKKDKTHGAMSEHVDAFAKFHATYAHLYMHANSYQQAMAEDRGEHERALKAGGIGYRFALTSASWEPTRCPGQTLALRQEWVNRNRSWCVYPYRLKLYLVDAAGKDAWTGVDRQFDPRCWLQGSTNLATSEFVLSDSVKPGTYDLRIALVDESGTPRVRLAISDGDTAKRYRLGSVAVAPSQQAARVPVVFKVSEGVRPSAVVSLYGQYLTGTPSVQFLKTDGSVAATQSAVQSDPGGHFCRVIFPSIPPGAYKLAVQNGDGWSIQAVYVNKPEPRWISEERAYSGLQLKLIGRNLDASEYNGIENTQIRLVHVNGGETTAIKPDAVNPYCVDFTVPTNLAVGSYFVEVNANSAEFGREWVRLNNHSEFPDSLRDTVIHIERAPTDKTALALKVTWANDFNWTNTVDVKRDYHAHGDGIADDTQAIQKALDDLAASGGGIVHLPNGVYKVDHLAIATGCILQGENREQTIVTVSRTGSEAIATKGGRHGVSELTLRYQPQAANDVQSTLIGGDANTLFFHNVTFDLLRNPDVSVQHSPYYVSGSGPMLVTGCRFFISSRNLWNHSVRNRVIFRDNFIDMHDGLGLCMSSEKLLVLNNELVFHPAAYAGQMNGFFLNEGWMGWNIYNAYIANNAAHDLSGPGDCQPFAADSAWSCVAGAVTGSTSNTVDIRADVNGDLKNLETREMELLVVQGTGLGQLRRVSMKTNLGGNPAVVRFTVSPAWDVAPDATSVASAGSWHVNNVFCRNTARSSKSPYNMYYGGSYDCVDADAVSENTEGWYNWGRIGEFTNSAWHTPVYFSQLKRSSFKGVAPQYGTMGITLRVENETVQYRGVADYGTEIRDNTIDRSFCSNKNQRLAGNAAIATFNQSWMPMTTNTPLIFATLCEGNTIKDSSVGFDLSKSFSFAIRGTVYENCPTPVNNNGYDTILLPGDPEPLKTTPWFKARAADHQFHSNAAIRAPSAVGQSQQLPELNWEPRADWINIRKDVKPPAVGDGIADDTAAIQAALNQVSEQDGKPTSVYLPPGTYRITKTLALKQKDGVSIIGCGRSTRIVWAGPGGKGDDSRMFWSDGAPRSRYVGITWDGQGVASVGFDHDSKGYFETEIDHQHEAFVNFTGSGIRIGHDQNSPGAQATAETTYMNCLFRNCESGITLMQFNDYNHTLTGCEFRDCGVGVNGTGGVNFYVRDSHFERSKVMDVHVRGEHGISVRRCSSIGSRMFLEAATIAPLTIQDCQVCGWTNSSGAITLGSGPVVLFDCVFSNPPTRHPPVVVSGGQHLILSHNQSEGTDGMVEPGNSQNVTEALPGELTGSLKSPAQTFFKETARIPGKVFDAIRDFGAKGDGQADDTSAIQATVNAARAHGNGALAYLPSGDYLISSALKVSGRDYFIGGCGVHSQLRGKNMQGQPLVQIDDPQQITLENIAIYGDGGDGSMDVLQTGSGASRMHYERVWVGGMYSKKPFSGGLHVRNLSRGAVVTGLHVNGNQHFSESARATILMNSSFEGSIIVDGKEPARDGILGFMTRLGTLVTHGLYVRDSQSIVMSDFYMEQSDRLLSFEGNPGDPAGKVTLQMPKSEAHLKPIIGMDNYHGRIALGSSMFYPGGPKTVEITHTGQNPIEFVYMASQAYGQKPVFSFASSGKLTLLENTGEGSGSNVIAEGGLKAVADSLDDLRRLGAVDLELNFRSERSSERGDH